MEQFTQVPTWSLYEPNVGFSENNKNFDESGPVRNSENFCKEIIFRGQKQLKFENVKRIKRRIWPSYYYLQPRRSTLSGMI